MNPMRGMLWVGTIVLLCLSQGNGIAQEITAKALYANAAVVQQGNRIIMLKVGEASDSGMVLVNSNPLRATVRYRGREYELSMATNNTPTVYAPPKVIRLVVTADSKGRWLEGGSINQQPVQLQLRPDLSHVVLSEHAAQRLGLSIDQESFGEVQVLHDEGVAKAITVDLQQVVVGSIAVSAVKAVVMEGGSPERVELGRSFLDQVEWREESEQLILTQHRAQ